MRYFYLLACLTFGLFIPSETKAQFEERHVCHLLPGYEYKPECNYKAGLDCKNISSLRTQHELNICARKDLSKSDLELKERLGNDELFNKWKVGRDALCDHITQRAFRGGSIRPMMNAHCRQRLNSESQRSCITGEDKQCG